MGMTIDKCADMFMAKEKCMERETSGTDTDCNIFNCDNCILCYEQGNMGEQKEALKFAIETMRKYQKIQEILNSASYVENGTEYSYTYDEDSRVKHIREVVEDGNDD